MARWAYIKLFLVVVLSSSLHSASIRNTASSEVDPIELNPEYSANGLRIHGGDMLYPEDLISDEMRQANNPDYYTGSDPTCSRWPDGELLFNRDRMSDGTFAVVKEAMEQWSTLSCAKFRQVESNSTGAFVRFTEYSGCYAHVGRICEQDGSNVLNLGDGCETLGLALHQLAHAMGVYHQHSRSDRDDYTAVNFENIQEGRKHNFKKLSRNKSSNFDADYDYCSIMQYSSATYGVNIDVETIAHINPNISLPHQKKGLAFGDIKLMNRMYNCDNHCPGNDTCEAPCFRNRNCVCWCPLDPNEDSTCIAYNRNLLPREVPIPSTTT